jgi:hypothetical protein
MPPLYGHLAALKTKETSNYLPFSLSRFPFPEVKRKEMSSFVVVLLYRKK